MRVRFYNREDLYFQLIADTLSPVTFQAETTKFGKFLNRSISYAFETLTQSADASSQLMLTDSRY